MVANNAPSSRQVAEVLQSMVAEAGFDLKIRVVEAATALKAAEDGDFQLYENDLERPQSIPTAIRCSTRPAARR